MSDYITLRDAIDLCGPRMFTEWSEFERRAPSRNELIAERTKILELSDEAILADAKATHSNQMKRLVRERKNAGQPLTSIEAALGKLRDEIAATKDKNKKDRLQAALTKLESSRSAKPTMPSKADLVKKHLDYLLTTLETLQEPALAALERKDTVHDRLRRAVMSKAFQAYVRLPLQSSRFGIVDPLPAEQFPEPGELRIHGANGSLLPGEVVFLRSDIEREFYAAAVSSTPAIEEDLEKLGCDYIAECKAGGTSPKFEAKDGSAFLDRAQAAFGIAAPRERCRAIWKKFRDKKTIEINRGRPKRPKIFR